MGGQDAGLLVIPHKKAEQQHSLIKVATQAGRQGASLGGEEGNKQSSYGGNVTVYCVSGPTGYGGQQQPRFQSARMSRPIDVVDSAPAILVRRAQIVFVFGRTGGSERSKQPRSATGHGEHWDELLYPLP
jgi:hypothetical protein